MGQSSSWEANSHSWSINSPTFMEFACSLLCLQESATGPYPDSGESGPHPHIILFQINFNIILPSSQGLPSCLYPSSFLSKILYAFLFSPMCATFTAHLILLDLIILIFMIIFVIRLLCCLTYYIDFTQQLCDVHVESEHTPLFTKFYV
jgi:hypothetical protein